VIPHVLELRRRGHDATVILPPGDGKLRRALERVHINLVESAFDFEFGPSIKTLQGLAGLRRQISSIQPDVLYYHLYASALAGRLATVFQGIPRVHMIAGPLYLDSFLIRTVERFLVRLDALVIAGSAHTEARYSKFAAANGKTVQIAYGVDTNAFRPPSSETRIEARRDLGIEPGHFVAIIVAYIYAPKRLVQRSLGIKGHEVLLRAWTEFHAQHPMSTLLLVGSGFDAAGETHRRVLRKRFDGDGQSSGLRWFDSVDDVRHLYAAADISVSPSLSENHGAALEATALGVPCIVSDAGGLPETVDDSTGWVVPAGNAARLRDALEAAHCEAETGRLPRRGKLSRALTESRFSQDRSTSAIVTLLEEISRSRGRHTRPSDEGTIRVFSEARFRRDPTGHWMTEDGLYGPEFWYRYARLFDRVDVVARTVDEGRSSGLKTDADVNLLPLPYYQGGQAALQALPALIRAIWHKSRAGICLVQLPGLIGTIAALVMRVSRRPYAAEVVGDVESVIRAGTLGRRTAWTAKSAAWVTRRAVRGARAVRYVTLGVLQAKYPASASAFSIGIARVRLADEDYAELPKAYPSTPYRLIAIGSHEQRYKGHDVLLDAVRLLRDGGLSVGLTIVGDGRYRSELEDQVASLHIEDCVAFTGWVQDRRRIIRILDSSDLFVMPSRTEGLPRALVEAMARGLPAVASNVGGIPELMPEQWLVPVDDAGVLAGSIRSLLLSQVSYETAATRNLSVARMYCDEVLAAFDKDWITALKAVGDSSARHGGPTWRC